jgi:phosphopantothenoylcysteine synthetase/decarboxylase
VPGRGRRLPGGRPGDGFLACWWTGPGRLADPADIVEAAAHVLSPQDLAGQRVVVTAGPTHEAIDPVRFLGNRSSGKMGAALAAAAQRWGAEVTLLLGPSAIAPPVGVTVVAFETAAHQRSPDHHRDENTNQDQEPRTFNHGTRWGDVVIVLGSMCLTSANSGRPGVIYLWDGGCGADGSR